MAVVDQEWPGSAVLDTRIISTVDIQGTVDIIRIQQGAENP